MNYLSSNIKHLRKSFNLTQEQFGKIVGKARSLISAWESDDRDITTEDIIKISQHFNIPMDRLVGVDLRIGPNDSDEELNNLQMITKILKAKGIINQDETITKDEFERLFEFIQASKKFIIVDKKDKEVQDEKM